MVKWISTLSVGLVLALAAAYAQQPPQELKTEKDLRSYALGRDLGNQLRKVSVEIDPALFAKAMAEALAGRETVMSDDDAKVIIGRLQAELKAKQMQPASAPDPKKVEENKKAGDAFLAENKRKPGVVTLPSGLQYKVLTAGSGKKPTANDTVKCQYRGTFIDGTEFDSSYSRNQPAVLPVTGVIRGWTEALQLMPVGSKWQLVVPPGLAYGPRGMGDKIGPETTLVFEIELLAIQ
jgi:FKBP-type peptidyl-prolyl cis-trans isomerase FklB